MEAEFWIKAWEDGRTAFHRRDINETLIQFFSKLQAKPQEKILVPLCGKTKDMRFLEQHDLKVYGVELYEKAIEEFFQENKYPQVKVIEEENFKVFQSGKIKISCGDFFKLKSEPSYDLIYDRAALVALPFEMRKSCAELLTRVLKDDGRYLLIVYEYPQDAMEGPPFSVTSDEIQKLYAENFHITLLEDQGPKEEGSKLSQLPGLRQKTYLLKKTAMGQSRACKL